MFWKKTEKTGPKALSGFLARLVSREMEKYPLSPTDSSDHWIKYMAIERAHADDKDTVDFRIFDQGAAERVRLRVVDYSSLDDHPDLVWYEGWYNRKDKKSEVRGKRAA